jgi:hypothetical protein
MDDEKLMMMLHIVTHHPALLGSGFRGRSEAEARFFRLLEGMSWLR